MDFFVFIGDSLTFGYGVKKEYCWVSKLRKISDFNIINKGINGNTTTDMLVRFDRDVLSYNPIKTFIMGGTNDLLCNRSILSIVENIEMMIKDLISNNIECIIGIPSDIIIEDAYKFFMESSTYDYCKSSLPLLRENLINLCHQYNCSYIDFYTLTNCNIDNNIYIDGIHLNEKGQNLIYEEFIKKYYSLH